MVEGKIICLQAIVPTPVMGLCVSEKQQEYGHRSRYCCRFPEGCEIYKNRQDLIDATPEFRKER